MRVAVEPSLQAEDYPFHHELRVRFAETDAMGVVHHSRYLPYLEEARVAYLRAIGHPYTEWRQESGDSAVIECLVSYRKPLYFDDVVTVHLKLAVVTRATFQMAYLLTVDGQPRATGVTVHACMTPDGRPTSLPTWLTDLGRRQVNASRDASSSHDR